MCSSFDRHYQFSFLAVMKNAAISIYAQVFCFVLFVLVAKYFHVRMHMSISIYIYIKYILMDHSLLSKLTGPFIGPSSSLPI